MLCRYFARSKANEYSKIEKEADSLIFKAGESESTFESLVSTAPSNNSAVCLSAPLHVQSL